MRCFVVLWMLAGCGRLGFDTRTDLTGDGPRSGDGTQQQGDGGGSAAGPLVQATTVMVGTGPQTLSLPAPTSAGTLLVASLGLNSLSGVTPPAGWQINANGSVSGGCVAAMATEISGAAGRQSFTFMAPAGAPVAMQITEWSGVLLGNPYDGSGFGGGGPTTSLTIATVLPNMSVGDLGIATFCEDTTMPAFTAGAGWTQLGQAANVASSPSLLTEVQTGEPALKITATATSSLSTKFAAVVMTFVVP